MVWFWLMACVALENSVVYGYKSWNLGPMQIGGDYGVLTPKYDALDSIDDKASANLKYFLEKLRNFFETGLGEIPPLDPYYSAKSDPVHVDDKDIQGIINFSHFYLLGAQRFKINTLELRVAARRVDFSVDFPTLSIHVDFDADITVDELHNYISGHANLTLNNVTITGALAVEGYPPENRTHDQILTISAFQYQLTTSNAQYNLKDGNLLEEQFVKAVRRRIRRSIEANTSSLVKTLAVAVADKISYSTAVAVVNQLNSILSYYKTAQILAILLPTFKSDRN